MGSDTTEYQSKTFMEINTPHMELESREFSLEIHALLSSRLPWIPFRGPYHVFQWLSVGKIEHVNSQPLLHMLSGLILRLEDR